MSVSFQCAEGSKLSDLDDYTVTRSGYTFDGWYEGNTKYTADSIMPSRNLNLTAKWTSNITTYKLYLQEFDTDGAPYWGNTVSVYINNVLKETITTSSGTDYISMNGNYFKASILDVEPGATVELRTTQNRGLIVENDGGRDSSATSKTLAGITGNWKTNSATSGSYGCSFTMPSSVVGLGPNLRGNDSGSAYYRCLYILGGVIAVSNRSSK